jgi:hypothetical protein
VTSNEHYRRAAAILSEVEKITNIRTDEDKELPKDALEMFNDNCQRQLKIAELHMRMAEYKKG